MRRQVSEARQLPKWAGRNGVDYPWETYAVVSAGVGLPRYVTIHLASRAGGMLYSRVITLAVTTAPEVPICMNAVRVAGRLATLLGCATGCAAAPRLAPLTITPGCYVVNVDNWPPAVAAETGLNSLPSFVALDTAAVGPRGRRVIAPTTWASAAPGHPQRVLDGGAPRQSPRIAGADFPGPRR